MQLESINFADLYESWKLTHNKLNDYYRLRHQADSETDGEYDRVWNKFWLDNNIDIGQRKRVEEILFDIDAGT